MLFRSTLEANGSRDNPKQANYPSYDGAPCVLSAVQAEMRERLAKEKGATYTYSMDYVSQTVSLVDEFRVKEDEEVKTNLDVSTVIFPFPKSGLRDLIGRVLDPIGCLLVSGNFLCSCFEVVDATPINIFFVY